MKIDGDLALEVACEAIKTGAVYADVFCQRRITSTIRFEEGKVDDVSGGVDAGAGVRVIKGDLAAFAHTDALDRDHMMEAAGVAAEALRYAEEGQTLTIVVPSRQAPVVCSVSAREHEVRAVAGLLARADDAARSLSGDVRQVTASHNTALDEELLADSTGKVHTASCTRTRFAVQVVAARGSEVQVGMEAPGALAGGEFYERIDVGKVAQKAAKRALTMLDAGKAPTGKMAVVMNSATGGVLIHEATGHGLEVDHVHRGASVFEGKVGEKVANDVVSVSDNPTLVDTWGSYSFDDEGTPSQDTLLIEDGVLRAYISDRHEAMKDGVASSGNGRRQSFRHLPRPRMSNTYIRPGKSDSEDIISSTPKGLFARKMGGGEVDTVTGDYVFAVSEGYLIESGKITTPVRGAMLIGNGPRTLETIDAVAGDLGFEEGMCGKDGQWVPVTTGGPTFRIAELTVGGTEV